MVDIPKAVEHIQKAMQALQGLESHAKYLQQRADSQRTYQNDDTVAKQVKSLHKIISDELKATVDKLLN